MEQYEVEWVGDLFEVARLHPTVQYGGGIMIRGGWSTHVDLPLETSRVPATREEIEEAQRTIIIALQDLPEGSVIEFGFDGGPGDRVAYSAQKRPGGYFDIYEVHS